MSRVLDVSVIAPHDHREARLMEAVQSALRQDDVAVEIIVVDESAGNSGPSVVEAVGDPRVRHVRCSPAASESFALLRNAGAAAARGRFLLFLDSGDVLEMKALGALAHALVAKPKTGMAFGVTVPFGAEEPALRVEQVRFRAAARVARSLWGRLDLAAHLLFGRTVFANSACLTRREAFEAAGGYDPAAGDVDLWVRIAREAGFAFVDRPVLRHRIDPAPSGERRDRTPDAADDAMRAKYRRTRGPTELLALKIVARTRRRWVPGP